MRIDFFGLPYVLTVSAACLAREQGVYRAARPLARLMVDSIHDILRHADTIVVGNGDPEFAAVIREASSKQRVVDLVRVMPTRTSEGAYQGICW